MPTANESAFLAGWANAGAAPLTRFLQSTVSTMDDARALRAEWRATGLPMAAVLADRQTGGHGRFDRPFSSEEGGMYLSLLLRLDGLPAPRGGLITLFTAVAVAEAIEEAASLPAGAIGCKWVNDLFLHEKKLCGILAEGVLAGNGCFSECLIGIGVNLRNPLPPALSTIATSLAAENAPVIPSPAALAGVIARHLFAAADTLNGSGFLDRYRRRMLFCGKRVLVSPTVTDAAPAPSFPAAILGVADDGALLVRDDSGTVREVYAGEFSVHLL